MEPTQYKPRIEEAWDAKKAEAYWQLFFPGEMNPRAKGDWAWVLRTCKYFGIAKPQQPNPLEEKKS